MRPCSRPGGEDRLDAEFIGKQACVDIGWSPNAPRSLGDPEIAAWHAAMTEIGAAPAPNTPSSAGPTTIFVRATAECGASCDGMQSAPFTDLREGLAAAGDGTTLSLAPGTYFAMGAGCAREDAAFVVADGVSVVGCLDEGFAQCADAGVLPAVPALSDLESATLPVGSGATDAADADRSDNALHVLVIGDRVTLSGLRITAGQADGDFRDGFGGGVLAWASRQITLDHIWFEDNLASHGGALGMGDMPDGDDSSVVRDSVFVGNLAKYGGGALVGRVGQLSFSISFDRVVFARNSSLLDRGGAVNVDYGFDAVCTDCLFEGNAARASSGGAIHLDDNASQFPGTVLSFVDTRFVDNVAAVRGGAIEAYNTMTYLFLSGVTMSGNMDGAGDNDVYFGYSATPRGASVRCTSTGGTARKKIGRAVRDAASRGVCWPPR